MPSTGTLPPQELTTGPEPSASSRRRWGRFALHYVQMVVAMLVGMLLLGGVLRAVLATAGVAYSMGRFPELVILEMGLTMALGMAVWMRYRGHGWVSTVEMSTAMVAPAVIMVPLIWLDLLDGGAAMMVEHMVMFPLMLAIMLRRRDEYSAAHSRHRRAAGAPGRRLRPAAGRALIGVLAFLLLPAIAYVVASGAYEQSRYAPPEATPAAAAAVAGTTPPAHDPDLPTAVVVVGTSGANVADTLAPYEVLASTGAFNVYIVAPERRLVTLLGGLDLVPDLSFAQLSARLGGAAPDVTVVPELPRSESSDAAVTGWLRDTASDGVVLGVCTGARLLAEAGLLDGREATSHWYRLDKLARDHPDVNWRRGIRYVDDGDVITTGGLLSSVDGTLRVVERFVDTDAATAAATAVGWRYYSAGSPAALPEAQLSPTNAMTHLLNYGFRANGTTIGVVLTDGVGELELAAAFAPYAEVKSARTLALATGGESIRSRHGLTFVPRAGLDAAERTGRLMVPGASAAADPAVAAAADGAGVPVDYPHRRPGFAFDQALADMARTIDLPTAEWAAKILEYPAAELDLSGPAWPWTPTLRPFLLGLAGLAAALGAQWWWRRARARSPRAVRP